MQLFIAEKPSMATAIASVLGIQKKDKGYYQCSNNTCVTWCFGHLFEQAMPEDYGIKKWSLKTLPIIPDEWKIKLRDDPGIKAQFKVIKSLFVNASTLINAGDPAREGQLLVDEVLDYIGVKKNQNIKRLWLNATDERSTQKALKNLRENSEFKPLKDSALARARADWLVGINLTRAVTISARNQVGIDQVLTLGRVQTPTLRLVVDRDRAHENFKPVDYFVPTITVRHKNGDFKATWMPGEDVDCLDPNGRLLDKQYAQELIEKANGQEGEIVKSKSTLKNKPPTFPHKLSTLQKETYNKYNIPIEKTLKIAQGLYEKKMTSYPRTDCQYLPEEQLSDAPEILSSLQDFLNIGKDADPSIKSKVWNTKKVVEHHAIIPTGNTGQLSGDELKIFTIIAKSYIRQFYPDMKYYAQEIIVLLANEHWQATGKIVKQKGWTVL